MLGTRTKQVNSYGRRGSRIVNVSDRPDQESASSSASDVDAPPPLRPLRRENAIIISPAKRHIARRLQGSGRSPKSSPLAQKRNMQLRATQNTTAKRTRSKLEPNIHVRQPLTPVRSNGTSSNDQPPSGKTGKYKTPPIKLARGLKPHAPIITVDIIVLDENGNTLKEERRLSHTDLKANHVCAAPGKGRKVTRTVPPSPQPIAISDDSDTEVTSPQPAIRRLNQRSRTIVISSDESEANEAGSTCGKLDVFPVRSQSRSKSQRAEVVVPPTPYRKPQVSKKPPSPSLLTVTPPRTRAPPVHSSRPGPTAVSSLLAPPILLAKPRQLTPIRGGPSRSIFRRLPPTPSTPSEADLSLDLAQLDLSDTTEIDDLASARAEYLIPLLNECAQTAPYEFSAFIETFPFDPIVQSSTGDEGAKFRKIGEASYSEVFGIGDVVLKIIPIRFEGELTHPEADEIPAPSDANDILKEIIVTREIGEICDNFVKLLKTYVVRGRYPSLLLDLWDGYNERKGSESIRPDSFGLMQVYAIIILPNGGPDLESFAFKNVSKSGWHQACGIFWQVARALEQAEHLVKFEHRDLHWGQILVKSVPVKKPTSKCPASPVAMDDTRFGVKVTIIDLGLSRMNAVDAEGSKVYWTPFDDEIFEGEGDYQYDIYRMMRDLVGGAWKVFHPFTNVMWLHYLVNKLLHEKRLKLPASGRQTGGVVSPTGYDEQECYDCLADIERLLGDWIASVRKGPKARRKTVALSSRPKSAKDVIAYGKRRGWIQ